VYALLDLLAGLALPANFAGAGFTIERHRERERSTIFLRVVCADKKICVRYPLILYSAKEHPPGAAFAQYLA
jgi:hypothetical protein